MNRNVKIFFSLLFICAIAFFVARGCWNFEVKVTPKRPSVKTVVKRKTLPPVVSEKKARMAIILDDWGNNLTLVQSAAEIRRPLTLSILPHLVHSREVAQEAKQNGLGVMLHMPMQAKSLKAPREPHTILTTTPDAQILEYLDQALDSLPEAEGVNNHQGSAATSDERVMHVVLTRLKAKGLFFVDSQVISTTVGKKVAREMGLPFTVRDVFIDNTATVDAIKEKLRSAQKIALARGRVVVIGHDKKPTLEAIAQMVTELENNGVRLVLVKELLE